jgi:hypothetical protein
VSAFSKIPCTPDPSLLRSWQLQPPDRRKAIEFAAPAEMARQKQKRVFISYSRIDKVLVAGITEILRAAGVPAFRDEDSISPGSIWQNVLEESLANASRVFVFWSRNAARSKAVRAECRTAIQMKKDIVPVLLDAARMPEWLSQYQAISLRECVILREGPRFCLPPPTWVDRFYRKVRDTLRALTPHGADYDSYSGDDLALADNRQESVARLFSERIREGDFGDDKPK